MHMPKRVRTLDFFKRVLDFHRCTCRVLCILSTTGSTNIVAVVNGLSNFQLESDSCHEAQSNHAPSVPCMTHE